MKKLLTRFDEIMSAVTFAEAGEPEEARRIMKESDAKRAGKADTCPHCGESLDIDAGLHPHKV